MTDQVWNKLKQKYPNILAKIDGAACEDGWGFLIEEACYQIKFYNSQHNVRLEILQIKEKFGALRIYYGIYGAHNRNDYIDGVLFTIENLSTKICEHCGSTKDMGKTTKGWIKSICCECSLELNRANEWHSLDYIKEQIQNKNPEFVFLEQIV